MSKIAQSLIWGSGWFSELGLGPNFCFFKLDGIVMPFMVVHENMPKLNFSKYLHKFEN